MRHLAIASAVAGAVLLAAGCQTPSKQPAAVANGKHAVDCAGASLALGDEAIVGRIDGQNITLKDLGPEAKAAEQKALYEYCDAVFQARNQALENFVTQKLVDKAAAAAGKNGDDWMQEQIQSRIPKPSDEEMKAFYEQRKREGMPKFEDADPMLKGQIVMVMQREKSEKAVDDILSGLRANVKLDKQLPDVRSPPRNVDITAHTAHKGVGKIQIVEFADFQCPYCSKAADAVRQLHAKYGDKIEVAYRNFPLKQIHPYAQHAAEVGQCAQAQGKFWEMSDKMYSDQDKLDEESLKASASSVGLDAAKLDACLQSGQGARDVEDDVKKAEELGVQGTPTFYVNGRQHLGAPTLEGLSAAVDEELKAR